MLSKPIDRMILGWHVIITDITSEQDPMSGQYYLNVEWEFAHNQIKEMFEQKIEIDKKTKEEHTYTVSAIPSDQLAKIKEKIQEALEDDIKSCIEIANGK